MYNSNNNNISYKAILLILSLTIVIIIVLMITQKKLFNDNNFITNNNNCHVLYDGKLLCYPARKKIKNKRITATAVDCNSNLIECKTDSDCSIKCLPLNYHISKCLTGLCQYTTESKEKSLCQNGGQITSSFKYGRLLTACICPENFIGLYCQTPNEMKASYSRTFELLYP